MSMENHCALQKEEKKAIISCPKEGCACHWVVQGEVGTLRY